MPTSSDTAQPSDPATLAAIIASLRSELSEERAARRAAELGLQAKALEAEQLCVQIARLRQERFGRSSENLAGEIEQLELRLYDLLCDIAGQDRAADGGEASEMADAASDKPTRTNRGRRPLPEHLPRQTAEHLPAAGYACTACGGALRRVGEDGTEIPEYRPGRFEVVRHLRPAYSYRACEAMTQAPMPRAKSEHSDSLGIPGADEL